MEPVVLSVFTLACAAASMAYLVRTYGWRLEAREEVSALIRVLVFIGVVVPLFCGVAVAVDGIFESVIFAPKHFAESLKATLISWTVLACALLVASRLDRLSGNQHDRRALLALAVVFIATHGLYIRLVDNGYWPDFAKIWTLTDTILSSGIESVSGTNIAQRATTYLVPLVYVFGHRVIVYKIANLIVSLVSSLMVYSLTRKWFGSSQARAAFLILLIVPEIYFASITTSWEVPAAFYLVLLFWLVDRLTDSMEGGRRARALVLALLLGAGIAVLELQRSTGRLYLGALVLFAVLVTLKSWSRDQTGDGRPLWVRRVRTAVETATLVVIVPFIVFSGVMGALHAARVTSQPAVTQRLVALYLGAYTSQYARGGSGYGREQKLKYFKHKDPAEIVEFGLRRAAAEWYYAPLDRVSGYLRRSKDLYSLGTSGRNYYNRPLPNSLVQNRRPFPVYNFAFLMAFGALGVVALAATRIRAEVPAQAYFPLIYLATFSFSTLLLSENQPRYGYVFWFTGTIYIADWWVRRRRAAAPEVVT